MYQRRFVSLLCRLSLSSNTFVFFLLTQRQTSHSIAKRECKWVDRDDTRDAKRHTQTHLASSSGFFTFPRRDPGLCNFGITAFRGRDGSIPCHNHICRGASVAVQWNAQMALHGVGDAQYLVINQHSVAVPSDVQPLRVLVFVANPGR